MDTLVGQVVRYFMHQRRWIWPLVGIVLLWGIIIGVLPFIPTIVLPDRMLGSTETIGGQLWTLVMSMVQSGIDTLPFLLCLGGVLSLVLWLMTSPRLIISRKAWLKATVALVYFFFLLFVAINCIEVIRTLLVQESGAPAIGISFVLFLIWLLCLLAVLLVLCSRLLLMPGALLISGIAVNHAAAFSIQHSLGKRGLLLRQFLGYACGVFLLVGLLFEFVPLAFPFVQFLVIVLLMMRMTGWYSVRYEKLTKSGNKQ